ncbi:MAG TPA: VOC family protein [Streptosporangiaceae bacterium]|jgi:predicted 3-demethylubiquinone-9 3-methyltransferase (glyoxalase superfamily)
MFSILPVSSGGVYRYTAMTAFTTFLWFDSQAEEAAQFYTSIFEDSSIDAVHRYTAAGPGPQGQVMLVEFTVNGQPFAALNGGPEYKFNPSVSFVIQCADQAEVDHYWDSLLAGGGVPNVCGWLNDKFGLSWQVVPTRFFEMMRDPARAAAVTQAMLAMTKFDIAALEQAYRSLFLARTLGRASSSSAQDAHQAGAWRTARSASLSVA